MTRSGCGVLSLRTPFDTTIRHLVFCGAQLRGLMVSFDPRWDRVPEKRGWHFLLVLPPVRAAETSPPRHPFAQPAPRHSSSR